MIKWEPFTWSPQNFVAMFLLVLLINYLDFGDLFCNVSPEFWISFCDALNVLTQRFTDLL